MYSGLYVNEATDIKGDISDDIAREKVIEASFKREPSKIGKLGTVRYIAWVISRDRILMQMHISVLQPKSMLIWIYV